MKKPIFSIFTTAAAACLLAGVIYFAAALAYQNRRGKAEAESRFSDLARSIEQAYTSPSESERKRLLAQACNGARNLAAIKLTRGETDIISWPDGAAVRKSAMTGSNTRTLSFPDNSRASLTASFYTLSSDDIFSTARVSFLIVLIGTLWAVILLVYISTGLNAARDGAGQDEDFSFDDYKSSKSYVEAARNTAARSDEPESQGLPEEEQSPSIDFSLHDKGTGPEEAPADPETADAPAQTEQEQADSPHGSDTGLYSEALLQPRLDNELVRAAGENQELTLFMVHVGGVLHSEPLAKQISKKLIETFRFWDMIFEYKDDCYAAIQQNIGVDEALNIAEELYAQLNSVLASAQISPDIAIGISSRSMRMIPGARLFTEAEQAMIHAQEDRESPIVAFRVDPEKYRQYLSSNA